ncbi:glycoside hydrolase family 43 protein [Robertkochia solimangrovi]|uniref:glycoside hydrolase family 43 protein n=1 Tax=Robertkochia solimangrovi TaxID=2213046 RepID=UPI0011807CD9|nr:glycoside hydrolase family 43 protein [Robertkochia solimangrovi]TRZ42936.1 beta-xylosidase [Robertkochia solimangrovi]
MKHFSLLLFAVLLTLNSNLVSGQGLENDQIYLADPTIFKDNDTYYLYGTKGDPRIKGEGFLVYTSKNLKDWSGPAGATEGYALIKGDAFGTKGFWAPQIFKHNNRYYMAYTADEHIAIATSDSPLGPFRNDGKDLEAPVRQIDPFIFFDEGKPYLYHVRLQDGNRIFVAEMTSDLTAIKPETLKECIYSEKDWEDTQKVEWTVAEGPTVFKHSGTYYLLYSANDYRNPDYAVGYATSKSPTGPWKKAKDSPIISLKNTGENGSGHGDLIIGTDGQLYYVFHTHLSSKEVHPRKSALTRLEFKGKKLFKKNEEVIWMKISGAE